MGLIRNFLKKISGNNKEEESKVQLLAQSAEIRSWINELRVKLGKAYAYDRKNKDIKWLIERFVRIINYIEEAYYFIKADNFEDASKNLGYLEKQINMEKFDDKLDTLINLNVLNKNDKNKAMAIRTTAIYLIKVMPSFNVK